MQAYVRKILRAAGMFLWKLQVFLRACVVSLSVACWLASECSIKEINRLLPYKGR